MAVRFNLNGAGGTAGNIEQSQRSGAIRTGNGVKEALKACSF